MSVEDKEALAIMEQSVKLEDGHYQIALPWKQYPSFLPYNRFMAERRLQTLKNRLLLDSELLENCKATMEQYLSKGHARRVILLRNQRTRQAAVVPSPSPGAEQTWKDTSGF